MHQKDRAFDTSGNDSRMHSSSAERRTTVLAGGMMLAGGAVIGLGGLIGAAVASPEVPGIAGLAAIRLAGIGILSAGVGLLPLPGNSVRRALLAYSAQATLYFCSLMLIAVLAGTSWPAGWIVGAAALHGAALVAIVGDWLRRHSAEGLEAGASVGDARNVLGLQKQGATSAGLKYPAMR